LTRPRLDGVSPAHTKEAKRQQRYEYTGVEKRPQFHAAMRASVAGPEESPHVTQQPHRPSSWVPPINGSNRSDPCHLSKPSTPLCDHRRGPGSWYNFSCGCCGCCGCILRLSTNLHTKRWRSFRSQATKTARHPTLLLETTGKSKTILCHPPPSSPRL
jgi:hypothetical protein